MGYYIETDSSKGKVEWILANTKSRETPRPFKGTTTEIPVVVVDNGLFEAAAICFDQGELDEFTRVNDTRPIRCLLVAREDVIRLNPESEKHLHWP